MKLSVFERECEQKIKKIIINSNESGILVRREKLTRGPSFRVKSGKCMLTGKKLIFIDRRLPLEQQLSMLQEEIGKVEAPSRTE
jgi:hypothetical protein